MPRLPSLLFVLLATAGVANAEDLRLDYLRESLTATYRHYTQYLDGVPVVGGEVIERAERDGRNRVTHRRLASLPVEPNGGHRIPRAQALLAMPEGRLLDQRPVILNENGTGRRAWRVVIEETPHHPWAHYVDAATGVVLRVEPLFSTVKGRVFDVNPVAKLNRPDLRDQNDSPAAVPDAAYSIVDLLDLPSSGLLVGPNVQIVDVQSPTTPHADAGQSLMFDRGQPQFEEVNAYFQIDRSQRYLQALGYVGTRRVAGYSIPVDPHAVGGTDNSFYTSGALPGQGELYFGDGGTDDAEDSDIMLHEFAHVMQDSIAPGAFFGSSASESRALGEGIGDYWAFSSSYVATIASGRDPYCIADWDARCAGDDPSQNCGYPAEADCLRRVDGTKTMSDFMNRNESGIEHLNGTIWSSALREIFDSQVLQYGTEAGKRRTDKLVIESMFGVPLSPTFALLGRRLLDADRALNAGATASVICTAMTRRGILGAADCDLAPRGDVTLFQSPQQGLAIPDSAVTGLVSTLRVSDPRSIERVSVDVDLEHSSQGDLEIFLTAPDGTRVTLASPSSNRTPFSRKQYGLTAIGVDSLDLLRGRNASGTWTLTIRDLRPGAIGTLRSWALLITFVGERPATSRPSSFAVHRHIAVVGHADGARSSTFISHVRLFNRASAEAHLTMVFTPSGENGLTRFSAVNVVVPSGATVALDDLVASLFLSRGMGQLEILGAIDGLLATSRAVLSSPTGRTSESIPVSRSDEATGMGVVKVLPQLENDAAFRTNLGIAETVGENGVVQFTLRDAAGAALGTIQQPILPFSHLQFPLAFSGSLLRADVEVVSGKARVLGYGSVIDQGSGDGMFVPATLPATSDEVRVVPAIHAEGETSASWRTDLTDTNVAASAAGIVVSAGSESVVHNLAAGQSERIEDVLGSFFGRSRSIEPLFVTLRAGTAATAHTRTLCATGGSCGEFVPSVPVTFSSAGNGPIELIGLEESIRERTNVGLINPSEEPALVQLTAYTSGGSVISRTEWSVLPREIRQIPLRSLVGGPLNNGRVRVEILSQNQRRLITYASVLDKTTGDPSYIHGLE